MYLVSPDYLGESFPPSSVLFWKRYTARGDSKLGKDKTSGIVTSSSSPTPVLARPAGVEDHAFEDVRGAG